MRALKLLVALIATLIGSAAGAVMIGVPASLAAPCHRQTRVAAVVALVLNIAVYPLTVATFETVQGIVGFTLAE